MTYLNSKSKFTVSFCLSRRIELKNLLYHYHPPLQICFPVTMNVQLALLLLCLTSSPLPGAVDWWSMNGDIFRDHTVVIATQRFSIKRILSTHAQVCIKFVSTQSLLNSIGHCECQSTSTKCFFLRIAWNIYKHVRNTKWSGTHTYIH